MHARNRGVLWEIGYKQCPHPLILWVGVGNEHGTHIVWLTWSQLWHGASKQVKVEAPSRFILGWSLWIWMASFQWIKLECLEPIIVNCVSFCVGMLWYSRLLTNPSLELPLAFPDINVQAVTILDLVDVPTVTVQVGFEQLLTNKSTDEDCHIRSKLGAISSCLWQNNLSVYLIPKLMNFFDSDHIRY
jgi:hypothetical protein